MVNRLRIKVKKGKNLKLDELNTDKVIFNALKLKPMMFGDISNYLKDNEEIIAVYANRKGLALALRRLQDKKLIIKLPPDKEHKYPYYQPLEKSNFDVMFEGFVFGEEFRQTLNDSILPLDDIRKNRKKKLSRKSLAINNLIHQYGISILYLILLSFKRKGNQKLWLKKALSYGEDHFGSSALDMFRSWCYEYQNMVFEHNTVDNPYRVLPEIEKLLKQQYKDTIKALESRIQIANDTKETTKEDWLSKPELLNRIMN